MAFFDFMNPTKGGLSLAEILGIPAQMGGQYLMQRNRRLGGPLGAALTGFGALGQTLGERQGQHAQNQAMFDALLKIDPKFSQVAPIVQAGGTIQDALAAYKEMNAKSQEGTPQKITANGVSGLLYPNSGREQWMAPGETFYEKPTADSSKPSAGRERYFKEHPSATEESYQNFLAGEKRLGDKPDKPPAPSWRTETDSTTGATVQKAYRFNAATGMMEEVPTAGEPSGVPAKLDTNERKQLDAVRNVSTQIPRLQSIIQQLPPDVSPAMLAREYAKFRAPFGALGAVDPRFESYFQQIGQLKASLISSAASGFRGQYMVNMLKQHIPSEMDPPSRAMEKVQGFDAGGFNAILQNYLGTGTPIARDGSSSGGVPPPPPPFEVDKAYNKDGRWYVKDKSGKFYQFDGAKWTPL